MPYENILKIKDNLVRSSNTIANEELLFRKNKAAAFFPR